MITTKTYTLNNVNHDKTDAVILQSGSEPLEQDLKYINSHIFDVANTYAKSKGWKLIRNTTKK